MKSIRSSTAIRFNADGHLGNGTLFFDMTSAPGEDAIDGMKVDKVEIVFVSGLRFVGSLAGGKHLGHVAWPGAPHNMAWGDADRQDLYLRPDRHLSQSALTFRGSRRWRKATVVLPVCIAPSHVVRVLRATQRAEVFASAREPTNRQAH